MPNMLVDPLGLSANISEFEALRAGEVPMGGVSTTISSKTAASGASSKSPTGANKNISGTNGSGNERTFITPVQDFASTYGSGFTQGVSDKVSGVVSLFTDPIGTISNAFTSEVNAVASIGSVGDAGGYLWNKFVQNDPTGQTWLLNQAYTHSTSLLNGTHPLEVANNAGYDAGSATADKAVDVATVTAASGAGRVIKAVKNTVTKVITRPAVVASETVVATERTIQETVVISNNDASGVLTAEAEVAKEGLTFNNGVKESFIKHFNSVGRHADLGLSVETMASKGMHLVESNMHLLKAGDNTLIGNVNGIQKSFKAFVKDGKILSVNMYPGVSKRVTNGTIINYRNVKW